MDKKQKQKNRAKKRRYKKLSSKNPKYSIDSILDRINKNISDIDEKLAEIDRKYSEIDYQTLLFSKKIEIIFFIIINIILSIFLIVFYTHFYKDILTIMMSVLSIFSLIVYNIFFIKNDNEKVYDSILITGTFLMLTVSILLKYEKVAEIFKFFPFFIFVAQTLNFFRVKDLAHKLKI